MGLMEEVRQEANVKIWEEVRWEFDMKIWEEEGRRSPTHTQRRAGAWRRRWSRNVEGTCGMLLPLPPIASLANSHTKPTMGRHRPPRAATETFTKPGPPS